MSWPGSGGGDADEGGTAGGRESAAVQSAGFAATVSRDHCPSQ